MGFQAVVAALRAVTVARGGDVPGPLVPAIRRVAPLTESCVVVNRLCALNRSGESGDSGLTGAVQTA